MLKQIVAEAKGEEPNENIRNDSVLAIDYDDLTPGMKQYQEAKRAHPDCLIMLRMGDFYEMFYEDAVTASRELEITLTARGKGDKRAPLAGVPFHALETYLARLIRKGHKVAIVEQLEDPKKAKGLVQRGIVRIITPGTIIESSMLNEKENNYLLALTAHEEVFTTAFCDLSTGEFFVKILGSPEELKVELARYIPSEVLIPSTLQVNRDLLSLLRHSGAIVNALDDYQFRVEQARELLQQHFQVATLHAFGLEDKDISAAGALLRYLIDTQKNTLSHLQKITLHNNAATMMLDPSTIRNLELVENIRDGSLRGTLLSVLDATTTPMGARLLRQWIKAPLLQKDAIQQRLNAVDVLNKNVIAREEIRERLRDVRDMERLLSRINYGTASPRDVLALQRSLQQIPALKVQLQSFSSSLLKELSGMEGMEDTAALISQAIVDEPPHSVREGGIMRSGFNAELDALRDIAINGKKYIQDLEEKERQRTAISSLKIGYTRVFGYFIEVTKKNLSLVPEHYIRKQTTVNAERYITEELKMEEEKILGAQEKMEELEYALFMTLLRKIAERTSSIQHAARQIATLDVLCSFASVAMEQAYVKPELVEESVIRISNGRHPVVEKLSERFIPNDIILQPGQMMIITGPNMSGKSTIMRQTALIVLMAQIGCFVPAEKAEWGIVDRIFTRVGAYDDLSSGQSTFMVEMTETAFILNNATERSLIILDEIGRGTSTFDGVSIAWSVAEHIHNKIRGKTLFATHYHVLNKLAEKFPRVLNYNVAVREVDENIILLHKLIEGGTDQSYGIHVAKLAGVPSEVVQRAKEIQEILEKDDEMTRRIKAKRLEEQKSLGEYHF